MDNKDWKEFERTLKDVMITLRKEKMIPMVIVGIRADTKIQDVISVVPVQREIVLLEAALAGAKAYAKTVN